MSLNIPMKELLKLVSPSLYTMATTIEGWANGMQWNPLTLPAGVWTIGTNKSDNLPSFCLDPFGFVHLRGLMESLVTAPQDFANIPPTLAPIADQYVCLQASIGAATPPGFLPWTVLVDTGGTLTLQGILFSTGGGDVVSLDGIVYPTF